MSEDPELWNDPGRAQTIMKERTRLDNRISNVRQIERTLSEQSEMIELAEMEDDQDLITEAENILLNLKTKVDKQQLESLLSGEVDGNDAYLEVNSGAGGTEACDWASMLLRMYLRWAEQHGYKTDILEMSDGEEAGIKSATVEIKGDNAFGWLKTEGGVHRLVRISPYDSNARRHTSFASVAVSPVVDDTIEIDIDEKDLRVDTYRASGKGGQHVNKTDSAVRITHIPTGAVAACQSGRSQHQNRDTAMKMLKARLYEIERQKQEAEKAEMQGEKTDIGWGHQIRSYVLHPYQMVKDLRTNAETSQSQSVLDGDIDMFLEKALAAQLGTQSEGQG